MLQLQSKDTTDLALQTYFMMKKTVSEQGELEVLGRLLPVESSENHVASDFSHQFLIVGIMVIIVFSCRTAGKNVWDDMYSASRTMLDASLEMITCFLNNFL